jgi:hypothetical protein
MSGVIESARARRGEEGKEREREREKEKEKERESEREKERERKKERERRTSFYVASLYVAQRKTTVIKKKTKSAGVFARR